MVSLNIDMKLNDSLGFCLGLLIYFFFLLSMNAQPKGYLYDESKVRSYKLPDPLVCLDETKIKTAEDWIKYRRPEVKRLFEDFVYGRSPSNNGYLKFEVIDELKDALNGKAIRKQVTIYLGNKTKSLGINLLIYSPVSHEVGAPCFLAMNFNGNHTVHSDPAILVSKTWVRNRNGIKNNQAREQDRGNAAPRWAIDEIIDRGYAFATLYYGDVDPDYEDGYENGVHGLFSMNDSLKSNQYNWASIGAWAWGLSRCLDYLEKDVLVDAKRVAVMGHSRLGKASLWAGARDERFAMVISNNSGCGGAALSRRRFGETVERINTSFPHWFCEKFKQYNGNEDNCPIDQHMLVALCAPRPIYIASAEKDLWADPKGEFLAAINAEPVYRLFGYKFGAKKMPRLNEPVHGHIGYHIRKGKHDVTSYDWKQYLDFADLHLK